ncbi:MAG: hypothetical protein ACI9R7_001948 [Lysobacterales bacterium]|jgi:uncharacterized protein (TIGR02466 family)
MNKMQLKFDLKKDLLHLFATPLGRFSLDSSKEVTAKIAEVILAKEAADPGIRRSNKGGWHSEDNLLDWPELEFADLEKTFRNVIHKMIAVTSQHKRFRADILLKAWANVNRPGCFNSAHVHPENQWSGVFYVKTADFSEDPIHRAGYIELHDPRGPIQMLSNPSSQPDKVGIAPSEGGILVFPSWLFHSVNAFSIDVARISIAFNARIEHFEAVPDKD